MGERANSSAESVSDVKAVQTELFETQKFDIKLNSLINIRPSTSQDHAFLKNHFPETDYGKKYGVTSEALNFNIDGAKGDTTNLALAYRDFLEATNETATEVKAYQVAVVESQENAYASTQNFEIKRQNVRTAIKNTMDMAVSEGLDAKDLPELEHRLKKFVINNPDFCATADFYSIDDRCTQVRLELFEEKDLASDSEINDDKYGVKLTKKAAPRFLGESEIRQAARAAGWPESEVDNVVRVSMAECRGDAHNASKSPNGTYDVGCMHINTVHSVAGELGAGMDFDNFQNNDVACLRLALKIKEKRGWKAWSSVNNGSAKISYDQSVDSVA